MVSHPLRMRKALGSIPSVSIGQWQSDCATRGIGLPCCSFVCVFVRMFVFSFVRSFVCLVV